MISDLPIDLAEEVFSRIPLTSSRGFRTTCKKWNTLSKDRGFNKKRIGQAKAEAMVVMLIDFRLHLMSLDLHNQSIHRQGKLVTLEVSDQVDISFVYHCDGLLLCITRDFTKFVVWNPYTCQTRWFEPRISHPRMDWFTYAIGYDKRSYKVLRFVEKVLDDLVSYEIYDLNFKSWKVLDVTSGCRIMYYARGVSLKGNTYWFAHENYPGNKDFLICFDFTKESFGPRLPLPFHSSEEDTVTLSSVREEQLAVLFQRWDTLYLEIWVTTTIEPDVVVWKQFLAVDPLTDFQFDVTSGSFFIEEHKKIAMVFDIDKEEDRAEGESCRNIAYILGENGYIREVDLGESTYEHEEDRPLGCSYVPSLVHIQRGKRKRRKKRRNRFGY